MHPLDTRHSDAATPRLYYILLLLSGARREGKQTFPVTIIYTAQTLRLRNIIKIIIIGRILSIGRGGVVDCLRVFTVLNSLNVYVTIYIYS